jgi:hypothetical protein
MGKQVNVTVVGADVAATVTDVAIVSMTGTILYQMYQNWVLGSELGLAWWDLVGERGVPDGEPSAECSCEYCWALTKGRMEGVEMNWVEAGTNKGAVGKEVGKIEQIPLENYEGVRQNEVAASA